MLIVGIDTKYASSGNTVNAALTPDLLDAGSVGIYTVDKTTGLFKLVVKNGSPSAGQVSSTTVTSGFIKIVQGLGNGSFFVSEYHDVKGIQTVKGAKYRAGSGQTIYVGYNPNTGSGDLNFIATSSLTQTIGNYTDINAREAGVKLRERYRGNNSYGPDIFFNEVVSPTDTALAVATRLVADINAYQEDGILGAKFSAVLSGAYLTAPVQSAAATATTGGTMVAGTYYLKVVALSATGNSLGSNEISIVVPAGTSTNTVTANWAVVTGATSYRVYIGTAAGAEANYVPVSGGSTVTLTLTGSGQTGYAAGTVPTGTNLGIAITVLDTYAKYAYAVYDSISQATTSSVDPVVPSGDPYQLQGTKGNYVKNEQESNIYRGDMYTMSTIEKKLPKTVDTTKTYDTYEITSINTSLDKTGQKATVDNQVKTLVAFVVQNNTLDTNQQANFEQIMTDIFAATDQISA